MSNQLGNILTVINDFKVPISSNTVDVDGYLATIVSTADYSPFGVQLDERTVSAESYRYGFNTQEKVDEISGAGNHTTAMFWEYDTRLGRRWNLDAKPNPSISNYAAFANNPIWYSDPDGDTLKFQGSFGFKLAAKLNFALLSVFSKSSRERINNLKESTHTFTVKKVSLKDIYNTGGRSKSWEVNDKNGIGASADIYFNFSLKGRKEYKNILASDGAGKGHIFVRVIGHEFVHADDIEKGIINRARNAQGVKTAEAKAVKGENTVYKELRWFDKGINYRDNYSGVPVLDNEPDPLVELPLPDNRSIDEIKN